MNWNLKMEVYAMADDKVRVKRNGVVSILKLGTLAKDGYCRGFSQELAIEAIVWSPNYLKWALGDELEPDKIPVRFVGEVGGKSFDFRSLEELQDFKGFLDAFFKEVEYWYSENKRIK